MCCQKCSQILTGNEKYCPQCGKKINYSSDYQAITIKEKNSTENMRSASIALGIISLIGLSLFIFSPISLILSLIGLIFAIKANKNTAGIILNAISLFLAVIITIFIGLILYFIITESRNLPDILNDYYQQNEAYSEANKF